MDWAYGWVGDLAEEGYEVWLMTQRGMKYADTNSKDGTWDLKTRWDFSWAEQGTIDIPAQLELVLEVTGKTTATLIGYSQGTSALWYGMAKRQAWYAERVARVIYLASCLQQPGAGVTHESTVAIYSKYDELNYYNANGNDASTVKNSVACKFVNDPKAGCEDSSYDGRGSPLKSTLYFLQISAAGKF